MIADLSNLKTYMRNICFSYDYPDGYLIRILNILSKPTINSIKTDCW